MNKKAFLSLVSAMTFAVTLAGVPAHADNDRGFGDSRNHDNDHDNDHDGDHGGGNHGGGHHGHKSPQVVVISLDGAKPDYIQKFIDEGVLPRDGGLARLSRRGAVA